MARAGVTRALIERTAIELADADGLDAVTLSAIARRLGVRPASMYAHVESVGALRILLHLRALAELAQRLERGTAGRAGRDALTAFAAGLRDLAADHPGLWETLQRTTAPEVAASEEAARVADPQLAVLRGYGLEGSDAVHATRFLAATLNGFVSLERTGAFAHRDVGVETSWALTLEALDATLERWPLAGGTPR